MDKMNTDKRKVETRQIVDTLITYHKPEYAADHLDISFKKFGKKCKLLDIPLDIGIEYDKSLAAVRETVKSFEIITNMITSAIPDTLRDKFIYAEKYSKGDDLVQSITSTKSDFMMAGFHVKSKDIGVESFCNEINRTFNMDNIIQQACVKASDISNIPFYYKTVTPKSKDVEDIKILDPKWLSIIPLSMVKDGKPQKAVILQISDEFKRIYRQNILLYKDIKMINEMKKAIPPKYLMALNNKGVTARRDCVELLEEDGEYVELINWRGERDRLVMPQMTAVFPDIRLRMLIRDGDYSIFHHIKHLIHQVKAGKTNTTQSGGFGLVSEILNQRLTDEKAQALKAVYSDIDKVMLEITDDTIEHKFNFPDPELFDYRKYLAVEQRILRWGGIALILLDATSSNYSGGYIYLKSLYADVMKWRNAIRRTLEDFYLTIAPAAGRGGLKTKMLDPKTRPHVLFDNTMMKEPKQILDEIKFLLDKGGGSWETIHEMFGIPHSIEMERKKQEWLDVKAEKQFLYPIYEGSQGLLQGYYVPPFQEKQENLPKQIPGKKPAGSPGNPEKDGLQTDNTKQPRQPRPSEATLKEIADMGLQVADFGIVKKVGTKWYVYSHDGTKKLSKGYKTKKEAVERLAEIEYFKNKDK